MAVPDRAPPEEAAPADEREHGLGDEAPPSKARWSRLLSWDSLRYQGSKWWIDRVLPGSPAGLIAAAILVPGIWFAIGYAITDDRGEFLVAADTRWQLWFLALHIVTVRVMASLWSRGLEPSLEGLGIAPARRAWVRAGALGNWANVAALVCGALWIARDTYMAFHVSPDSGLSTFDDPDMWAYGPLGHQIRTMMLIVWHLEWVIFGYLLWLQIWALFAIGRAVRKTDFRPHFERMLIRDEYRDYFALVSRTATIILVFSLGNLLFLYLSDELFPREVVVIDGFGDVVEQMSDLLSIGAMFILLIVGMFASLGSLKKALTRALTQRYGASGDAALELLGAPVELSGDAGADAERLRSSLDAHATVLRSITFQREIDQLGGRAMRTVMAKATPALGAVIKRLLKMQIGAP
jgi:hypothetical protein